MARNKVQFQKGMSEAQFEAAYGTEELCHAALVNWRGPEGFECPGCEGRRRCIVKRGGRILHQCNACRKQTSVKAGTIFASSKLPLRLWFKAMYLLTQSKKGVSSLELGRRLGVTQTTAWTLKHKLAQVMIERNAAKRLKGDVQMDDAYLGGSRPGTSGRGAAGKTPFVAAVSMTRDGKPDQIALRRVERFSKTAIARFAGANACGRRSRGVRWIPLLFRSDRGRMRPYPGQDRRRSESGEKPALQMGQHPPWRHQGRNGWDLQSRARQTRAEIPRRIRIPLQPKIQARSHDRQACIRLAQDSSYAVQTAEIG